MNDRVKLVDWVIALAVGCVATAALWVFSVPGLDPELWETSAIVHGFLPPKTFFPGVFRYLPGMMSPLPGAVGGGVLAFLICMTVRTSLVIMAHASAGMSVWRWVYAPVFAAVTALLAIASDPVWRACQVLTPTLMLLIAFAALALLFFSWLWYARDWMLYLLMFLAGVTASESALVFLLLLFFAGCLIRIWRSIVNGVYKPLVDLPSLGEMPKWRMLLCFVLGFAGFAALSIKTFELAGGPAAAGWANADLLVRYGTALLQSLAFAASPVGWVLVLLIGVLPLCGAVGVLAGQASDEYPMSFGFGLAALLCGFVAAFQVMPLPSTWFWQWNHQMIVVRDPMLLALVCVFSAAAVVFALSTFVIENYGQAGVYEGFTRLLLLTWAPATVVIVFVFSLTGVWRPGISQMQRLVDDAVTETLDESEGVEWLFTDGSCDIALELGAARRGQMLRPISMMSSSSDRDVYLRLRGLTNELDIVSAKQGAPALLRVWAGEKPAAMARAGIQLGFEFWKRANQALPEAAGLVARTVWPDPTALAKGRAAGDELAQRVLDIAARDDIAGASPALRKAFDDVAWRLSRLARNRDKDELADKLDLSNSALKRMLQTVEYERIRTFMQLTPREALQFALKRADFVEARRYVFAILQDNEDDADANFALGMYFLMDRKYTEAERYLRRCLKTRPQEPAVINNLSIICRKTRRYDEAIELARRAAKLLPNSKEVKQTLVDAEKRAP